MKKFPYIVTLLLCLTQAAQAFYDPSVGKWLNRDPKGEAGGVNLTAYCGNDPVNRVDPLGLWTLTNDGRLEWDGHLNIYKQGWSDDDASIGLLYEYKGLRSFLVEALLHNKRNEVRLPTGQIVMKEELRKAYLANKKVLDDLVAKPDRLLSAIIEDGHISKKEAQVVGKAIAIGSRDVGSLLEHWNIRKILNSDRELRALAKKHKKAFTTRNRQGTGRVVLPGSTEEWKLLLPVASAFHGPGCYKWCSTAGRELVLSSKGVFEGRIKYIGTFNYGNNPYKGTAIEHRDHDMVPYYDAGSGPHDKAPGAPSKSKQTATKAFFMLIDIPKHVERRWF